MSGGQQNNIHEQNIIDLMQRHLNDLQQVQQELESRGLTQAASSTQLLHSRLKDIEQQLSGLDNSLGHDLTPGSLRYLWRQLDRLGDCSESDVLKAYDAYVAEQSKA